jgi:hypothetical protein
MSDLRMPRTPVDVDGKPIHEIDVRRNLEVPHICKGPGYCCTDGKDAMATGITCAPSAYFARRRNEPSNPPRSARLRVRQSSASHRRLVRRVRATRGRQLRRDEGRVRRRQTALQCHRGGVERTTPTIPIGGGMSRGSSESSFCEVF